VPRPSDRGGATIGGAEERDDHPATIPAVPQSPATAWGWPAICDRLLDSPTAGPGLRGLASLLRELLAERGMRNLAFTGQGRAAGRTSLLLCVAKLLADDPASRIAIVDLDIGRPSIARRLGVAPAIGLWELAGGANPAHAIIPLVRGRLSLLGLTESVPPSGISAGHVAAIEAALRGLREEFDVVLIDVGPREASLTTHPLPPPAIEACVCVSRHGESGGELSLCESYRQAGIEVLGILETFVPAPSAGAAAA
jgi:Mrp family chromosome partitioning ATPase